MNNKVLVISLVTETNDLLRGDLVEFEDTVHPSG